MILYLILFHIIFFFNFFYTIFFFFKPSELTKSLTKLSKIFHLTNIKVKSISHPTDHFHHLPNKQNPDKNSIKPTEVRLHHHTTNRCYFSDEWNSATFGARARQMGALVNSQKLYSYLRTFLAYLPWLRTSNVIKYQRNFIQPSLVFVDFIFERCFQLQSPPQLGVRYQINFTIFTKRFLSEKANRVYITRVQAV